MWVQHLQLRRHSLERFLFLKYSSRNALYIHRGSHPNPRKEPSEQSLWHAVIENGKLTIATIDLQANSYKFL